MSHKQRQAGFTLIELLVVIAMVGILAGAFYRFFGSSLVQYLHLQSDASSSATIAAKSQRVASVVRGTTGIISATGNELQIYAYFYPSDTYVSKVRYYLSSNKTVLYSEVTPMSSNPPIGTPVTSKLKTYTIMTNVYLQTGSSLFSYLDASNDALTIPINDLNAIKIIQTNLAFKLADGGNQALPLQVELRNRKTNL